MSDEKKIEETLEAIEEGAELSEEELDKVAGGFCILIGANDGPDADCGTMDFFACAYLGVSFGGD